MPDDRDVRLSQGDTVLAARMRDELGTSIEIQTAALIKAPAGDHDRIAGFIEGLQAALRMVDGTYSQINNPRPTKEATVAGQ